MSTPASTTDGLLSLSLAAASAAPIPVVREPSQDGAGSYNGSSSLSASGKSHSLQKHRRLSSTNHARRLSEAREAASRPSPVTIQSAAAALNSLAALSLSGSPPPRTSPQPSISFVSASANTRPTSQPIPITSSTKVEQDEEIDLGSFDLGVGVKAEISGAGISVSSKGGNGKKRSTIFKCETCAKVYRHPSCLIKHRWEHSPHWREASKFLLSKHQQVQLLEAAAILSHLAPSGRGGTSLPEDRSLWPSYLSGGLLPPPSTANVAPDPSAAPSSLRSGASREASVRPSSAASRPRMHDYAIAGSGGITHVRPGVVSVPTASAASSPLPDTAPVRSVPVPVPGLRAPTQSEREAYSFVSAPSDAWSSPISLGFAQSSFRSSALGESLAEGGWSLPPSSVRSASRSRSGSVSEGEFIDVDGDDEAGRRYGFTARSLWRQDSATRGGVGQEKIEEEWDGMEMEMEM